MEFENLQAIWDTQNDKPVFAMQDARLLVALYQQREHSRRRLFKEQFAPAYVAALLMLAVGGNVFFASLGKRIARGFPMSGWDGVAFAVAAGALVAMVASMYAERKMHERTQEGFAPSLREELERGMAQLDFEMSLQSTPRVMKILILLSIGGLILNLEIGRLTGNLTPWKLVLVTLFCVFLGTWAGFVAKKKVMERARARRRALELMRAALDEDAVVLPRK